MRKIFVSAVFAAVLGVAQMSFSATLVDVPSGHWAEDAVQRLVDMNLVKGYPDGTFKGDRQLTRYEYAMVVDRMIDMLDETYCKQGECGGAVMDEKALNEVRDIVKKLAAEFKDELAALKVKVDENSAKIAGLEEEIKASRIGNIKVEGSVRQRVDVPSTDLTPSVFGANYMNAMYGAGLGSVNVDPGYEMVPTLVFSGKSGDNIDFSIGLDKSIRTSPLGYDQIAAGDDQGELVIDHAYADIDFSDTVRELDLLKVKSGYQSFSFGPYGMLVDNNGVKSNAAVRVDVAKDVVSLTGIVALASQTGIGGGALQGIGAAGKDAYAAVRLGLGLPWLDLGVNYLADGVMEEQGWGVDVVLPMLKNTPFLNELRAEYLGVTDLQNGTSPAATADDYSFIIGVDVYTNKKASLTLSYADLPATVAYSSMDVNPFTEYDSSCALGLDVGPASCYSSEASSILFPSGFEGLGVEASYIVFNDVTLAAKAFVGNFAGGTNPWSAANLDGDDYPGFGALSVSKPVNDKATFRVEYAQQGADTILLNRVRGELVINF